MVHVQFINLIRSLTESGAAEVSAKRRVEWQDSCRRSEMDLFSERKYGFARFPSFISLVQNSSARSKWYRLAYVKETMVNGKACANFPHHPYLMRGSEDWNELLPLKACTSLTMDEASRTIGTFPGPAVNSPQGDPEALYLFSPTTSPSILHSQIYHPMTTLQMMRTSSPRSLNSTHSKLSY